MSHRRRNVHKAKRKATGKARDAKLQAALYDLRPMGRIPERALRPLIAERNADIAPMVVEQLKKRMKSTPLTPITVETEGIEGKK